MAYTMSEENIRRVWCLICDTFRCDQEFRTKEAVAKVQKEFRLAPRTAQLYTNHTLREVAKQEEPVERQVVRVGFGRWVLPSGPIEGVV